MNQACIFITLPELTFEQSNITSAQLIYLSCLFEHVIALSRLTLVPGTQLAAVNQMMRQPLRCLSLIGCH